MKIERLPSDNKNVAEFIVTEIEGALSSVYAGFSDEPIGGYEKAIKNELEKARINNTFPFKLD